MQNINNEMTVDNQGDQIGRVRTNSLAGRSERSNKSKKYISERNESDEK